MRPLTEIHKKIKSLQKQKERAMLVPAMERGNSIDYLDRQLTRHIQNAMLHPDNELACESLAGRCCWEKVENVSICNACGRVRR